MDRSSVSKETILKPPCQVLSLLDRSSVLAAGGEETETIFLPAVRFPRCILIEVILVLGTEELKQAFSLMLTSLTCLLTPSTSKCL